MEVLNSQHNTRKREVMHTEGQVVRRGDQVPYQLSRADAAPGGTYALRDGIDGVAFVDQRHDLFAMAEETATCC